jgi:hypothetical protein
LNIVLFCPVPAKPKQKTARIECYHNLQESVSHKSIRPWMCFCLQAWCSVHMKVPFFASLMFNAHGGTFVCKLDAQCTWRYTLFASWMLCAQGGAFHLQAQCPMHIHERDLSFASLILNAQPWMYSVICKLDAQCASMKVTFHL